MLPQGHTKWYLKSYIALGLDVLHPVLDYILSLFYIQTNYRLKLTGWMVCLAGIVEDHLDQASVSL